MGYLRNCALVEFPSRNFHLRLRGLRGVSSVLALDYSLHACSRGGMESLEHKTKVRRLSCCVLMVAVAFFCYLDF